VVILLTMPASEPSVLSGVLGALTFYIFSCGCFAPRPQAHREAKVTADLWREEIENHPSPFYSTPHSMPSTPNNEAGHYPVEPTCMLELPQRSATMNLRRPDTAAAAGLAIPPRAATMPRPSTSSAHSRRRVNPPVNERHPPVVSAVSERGETGWMTLPPPTARETKELNRHINRTRAEEARSRPGSAASAQSRALPLEVENLVPYGAGYSRRKKKRFEEGVLEDMDGPVKFGTYSRRGTEEAARGKGG
jgi:hypothetical protein